MSQMSLGKGRYSCNSIHFHSQCICRVKICFSGTKDWFSFLLVVRIRLHFLLPNIDLLGPNHSPTTADGGSVQEYRFTLFLVIPEVRELTPPDQPKMGLSENRTPPIPFWIMIIFLWPFAILVGIPNFQRIPNPATLNPATSPHLGRPAPLEIRRPSSSKILCSILTATIRGMKASQ